MLKTTLITQFVMHLETMGSTPETLRAYRTDLTQVHAEVGDLYDWAATEHAMARYLTGHRSTWAPKTINRRLGTFRSYARWAGAPHTFLAAYRPPKPAPPVPHPIPEGIDGVMRMIRSTRNPRHRALCALTGLLGLRVNEAIAVAPAHIDLDEMTVRVLGKGDKYRDVPISAAAWMHLEKAYELALANDTTLTRITNAGARRAISRHGRNARLSGHVKSHDMRATLATFAYDKSKDIRAVQEILGHTDIRTTQTYTMVSRDAMRAAIEVA